MKEEEEDPLLALWNAPASTPAAAATHEDYQTLIDYDSYPEPVSADAMLQSSVTASASPAIVCTDSHLPVSSASVSSGNVGTGSHLPLASASASSGNVGTTGSHLPLASASASSATRALESQSPESDQASATSKSGDDGDEQPAVRNSGNDHAYALLRSGWDVDTSRHMFRSRSRSPQPEGIVSGPVSMNVEEEIKWIWSGIVETHLSVTHIAWNLCLQQRLSPCCFKVGISGRPEVRWAEEYFWAGFFRMYILFRSEDPEPVEAMEERLIQKLRIKVRESGRADRPTCMNINPGREGTMRFGPPPYFVYLVVGSGRHLGATRVARERHRRMVRAQAAEATGSAKITSSCIYATGRGPGPGVPMYIYATGP